MPQVSFLTPYYMQIKACYGLAASFLTRSKKSRSCSEQGISRLGLSSNELFVVWSVMRMAVVE